MRDQQFLHDAPENLCELMSSDNENNKLQHKYFNRVRVIVSKFGMHFLQSGWPQCLSKQTSFALDEVSDPDIDHYITVACTVIFGHITILS